MRLDGRSRWTRSGTTEARLRLRRAIVERLAPPVRRAEPAREHGGDVGDRDEDDRVVAYASLKTRSVDLSAAPPAPRKHAPDPVPTIHCGCLAVDRRCAGLGVGGSLVGRVLATAVDINRSAAPKAVTVTALNQRARIWREGFSFEPFDPAGAHCLDMYVSSPPTSRRR